MTQEINWLQVLVQTRNAIQKQITTLIKTARQPQPNLGVGAGGDPIKQVDLAAESVIVNTLISNQISFTLISEESGITEYGKTAYEHYATVDPIDGTTNVMRGIPFYATSLAVSAKPTLNTIHTALVADLVHDINYTAQSGLGAFRNGEQIFSSKTISLKEAVIGMDLNAFGIQELVPKLSSLIQRTRYLRHLGANALELCYVADGTTDAFIDIRGKLRATDMAAAWLITREAGAKMTTLDGKPLDIRLDPRQTVAFITSANQEIHENMLDLIRIEKEKP
jgi:myo-inositol-1(or 4)-monophosphatase